jgi:hypothetical protein
MGTWIAIAGVICLVVSAIWAAMDYLARLRTWKAALFGTCIACLVGSVTGLAMVHIATEHNPQGEFLIHATGAINYTGLAEIFVSWFAVVSVAASLAFSLVVWMLRGLGSLYQLVTREERHAPFRRADRLDRRAR